MCDIYEKYIQIDIKNFQAYTFQGLERSLRNYRSSLHDSQISNTLYIDFKHNIITFVHIIQQLICLKNNTSETDVAPWC